MREYDLDLQLHGPWAGGTSRNISIPVLSEQARLKGLDVLVTADILHKQWFEHVKNNIEEESNGVYRDIKAKCNFIVGGEIEDNHRIHHLFYLPSIESAAELRTKFEGKGSLDCSMCGRPKLHVGAEEFAQKVHDCGGIFGPAHSFTPYTGIYAYHDSLKEAYGQMHKHLDFIELGLSADTDLADLISDNHSYTFLTSSDAHSPWPHRLGREFNRIKMARPDFKSLKRALEEKDEQLITLNAGLNPKEGKYHATACNSCFSKYSMDEAVNLKWKCLKCAGQIKRGVRDRINMLADSRQGSHPKFRPKYMHQLPLAEIVQQALGAKSAQTKEVQQRWLAIVEKFGDEITALVDAKEQELLEADKAVGEKIIAFRNELVLYIPGGGGQYGVPIICSSKEEMEKKQKEIARELEGLSGFSGQRTLGQFSGESDNKD